MDFVVYSCDLCHSRSLRNHEYQAAWLFYTPLFHTLEGVDDTLVEEAVTMFSANIWEAFAREYYSGAALAVENRLKPIKTVQSGMLQDKRGMWGRSLMHKRLV